MAEIWICVRCGCRNQPEAKVCLKCELDKSSALSITLKRPRTTCDDCGHTHRDGYSCHVYCEEIPIPQTTEDDNEMLANTEKPKILFDDDSDDGSLGVSRNIRSLIPVNEREEIVELETPKFVQSIGYIRCNCQTGVPSNSRRFAAIPKDLYVGSIKIKLYEDITKPKPKSKKQLKEEERLAGERLIEQREALTHLIPLILSYLYPGECGVAAVLCTQWRAGAELHLPYVDMRNCVPWNVIRAHSGPVESLALFADHLLFSGGDRRIQAWDWAESGGVHLHTVARDSGAIPGMMIREGELVSCSGNGSIRTFSINHDVRTMLPGKVMWGHSRTVTHLMVGTPSVGLCASHHMMNHVCFLYSVSGDRTLQVWSALTLQCERSVSLKILRNDSLVSLTQSSRHLFLGSSGGAVLVLSKLPMCEREDMHTCSLPGADKTYCTQVSLRLPAFPTPSGHPVSVTTLHLSHYVPSSLYNSYIPPDERTCLWAGDSRGQITLWFVPDEGLDFRPRRTWRAHGGTAPSGSKWVGGAGPEGMLTIESQVTGGEGGAGGGRDRGVGMLKGCGVVQIQSTMSHIASIGGDGLLIFTELARLTVVRRIDLTDWAFSRGLLSNPQVPRRLKSLAFQSPIERESLLAIGGGSGCKGGSGGVLVIGTSYGEVFVLSTGYSI